MKKLNKIMLLSAFLNIANVILVSLSVVSFFVFKGTGNMEVNGVDCFKYFTIDSNILSAIVSLLLIPFLLKGEIPVWVEITKFVGTVAVTVTFLTVVFFLGPTQGYAKMFAGVCLYLHLICPVISIVSFYLSKKSKPISSKSWIFGTIPVIVYGAVYIVMVLITKKWEDFYGFNINGLWYISLVAMTVFSGALSAFMALISRKTSK